MRRWIVAAVCVGAGAGCSLLAAPILDGVESSHADGSSPGGDGSGRDGPIGGYEGGIDGCPTLDCTNPACLAGGFACVPAAPSTWAYAALFDAQVACSGGTVASSIIYDVQGAPATCTCDCTVMAPSCTVGSVVTHAGSGCANGGPLLKANDNQCAPTNITVSGISGVRIDPLAVTQGSCTSLPPQVSKAPPTFAQGVACEATGVGVGCDAGNVCAWLGPGQGGRACIVGSGTCPSPYGDTHTAGSTPVMDDRDCACMPCGYAGSCTQQEAHLYLDDQCTEGGLTVAAGAGCHQGGSTVTYRSFTYSATVSASCDAGPMPSTGSVGPSNPETLCCAK
jgi:hypothetical protein